MSARIKRECFCPRVRHMHGTEAAYSDDQCRCMPCALARARYIRALRAGEPTERRTADMHGSRQRLRALTWMGWSPPELSEASGFAVRTLQELRNDAPRRRSVLFATRDAIAELYDQLWNQNATGMHALRMHNMAVNRHWPAPMDLDDDDLDIDRRVINESTEIDSLHESYLHTLRSSSPSLHSEPRIDPLVVDDLMAGLKPAAKPAELSHAARTLTDMGHTAKAIAERLGVTQRTVVRYRAQQRDREVA